MPTCNNSNNNEYVYSPMQAGPEVATPGKKNYILNAFWCILGSKNGHCHCFYRDPKHRPIDIKVYNTNSGNSGSNQRIGCAVIKDLGHRITSVSADYKEEQW